MYRELGDDIGTCAAVGIASGQGEDVVIVAETGAPDERHDDIRSRIKRALFSELAIAPADVMLVRFDELPRTTTGKVQRRAVKETYLTAGRE